MAMMKFPPYPKIKISNAETKGWARVTIYDENDCPLESLTVLDSVRNTAHAWDILISKYHNKEKGNESQSK